MSNERHRPDEITDPIVSGSYREIADECTPEHLDHVVLNEARGAALQRHHKTVSWLRPAAWATTIGLCLVIVLEFADMPQQEQPVFDAPAEDREESIVGTPASEARTARPDKAAAIEVDSLDDADMQIVREAENRALLQTGSDEEAGRNLLQTAPAIRFLGEVAAERYCTESETGDPNSWLECIQRLEKDGLYEAARIERELLKESFPAAEQP